MHKGFDQGDTLYRRARAVDGRALTRPDVLADDVLGQTRYPRFISSARGAEVWDIDGNRYIDLLLGYGPVILGHAHEGVNAAAADELVTGHCFAPLWSPRQVELCELLCEVVPGTEAALILKTGSDATSAAVRLARIVTGRDHVVRWGYNGWHDWANERRAGIPDSTTALTSTFDGGVEDLRNELARRPGSVACVVMMPFHERATTHEHLATVRQLCHEHGALLVFDEMRSGFRVALGGAQELLGVQADLVAIGKAMGNGYSISALCGSRAVLQAMEQTKISSTYFANPADMAAAIATIRILRDTDALRIVWERGASLQAGLQEVLMAHSVPGEVVGYPPMPMLRFTDPDSERRAETTQRVFAEVTRRGVLAHPDHQWFLSAAHTERHIRQVIDVFDAALSTVCTATRR